VAKAGTVAMLAISPQNRKKIHSPSLFGGVNRPIFPGLCSDWETVRGKTTIFRSEAGMHHFLTVAVAFIVTSTE
jgi:hypothetical protein